MPPNLLFNIAGDIVLTENQIPKNRKINKILGLEKRTIIKKEHNLIKDEKQILLLSSNIFPEIEEKLTPFKTKAETKEFIDFIDAPVYYKDIFNELRTKRQIYEIFILEITKFNRTEQDSLWQLCFKPKVTVLKNQ